MQVLLRLIYPSQCLSCGDQVETDFALCPACWRDTPFITGLVCDGCGTPLPGEDTAHVHCDDCLTIARPWDQGRAALLYRDTGRKLVLSLKHGDRSDLARPAARWMHRAAAPILRRRYNQSALISAAFARLAALDHIPDLLTRSRRTPTQDGRDRDGRFRNVTGAIRAHPRHAPTLKGREVLLIDDVMTSGATLAACSDACLAAGATRVSVCVLARVAKDA